MNKTGYSEMKTEDRGQRSENRGQRSENRGQRSENRGQRTEVRGQRTNDRGQRTEDRKREAGIEERKAESVKGERLLTLSASRFPLYGILFSHLSSLISHLSLLCTIRYLLFALPCLYGAGTTVGDVLNLNTSIRAISLGKTHLFNSEVGGNPALIDDRNTVAFKFNTSPLGVRIFDIGGKMSYGSFTFGAGIINQNAGNIEIYKPPFEDNPEVKFVKNLQNDLILTAVSAYRVNRIFHVGLNIRHLNTKILENYTMDATAFDLGMAVKSGKFNLAFLLKNLGSKASYSYSNEKFPLAAVHSFGVGFFPSYFGIIFSADNENERKQTLFRTGIEWNLPDEKIYPLNTLAIRGGYSQRGAKFNFSNFTFGFSMGFSSVLFEYALSPLDDVGLSHNLGLSYRFGHKTKIPESKIKERVMIEFVAGNIDDKSFAKLEDTAQLLKESPHYSVKLEGHLDLTDKIVDYFVSSERIAESRIIVEEKETTYVIITLIEK